MLPAAASADAMAEQAATSGALPVTSIQSISAVADAVVDCRRIVLRPAVSDTVAEAYANVVLLPVRGKGCVVVAVILFTSSAVVKVLPAPPFT